MYAETKTTEQEPASADGGAGSKAKVDDGEIEDADFEVVDDDK